MKSRAYIMFLVIICLAAAAGCGGQDLSGESGGDAITQQAEQMLEASIIPGLKSHGEKIESYEVKAVPLKDKIPYGGGNFEFYEIEYSVVPDVEEKPDAFISAYNDGEELYEFLWLYGAGLPGGEDGKYDFKEYVDYRYVSLEEKTVEAEYTFKFGDTTLAMEQNFKGKLPLKNASVHREIALDNLAYFARFEEIWQDNYIRVGTQIQFERHLEPIYSMYTTNSAVETQRGIKVGDSEEKLFETYGAENLVFFSYWGGESFNGYGMDKGASPEAYRGFGFAGQDDTQNYIAFYIENDMVSAIEMGNGFDYKPFRRETPQFPLEVADFINEHVDEPGIMRFDIILPMVTGGAISANGINALIQTDFEDIIAQVQSGSYEISDIRGFAYPWTDISYKVSNLGDVAVINIFSVYSSAFGSGGVQQVRSYYYDTTCGARMSEDAALYRLGYSEDVIESYFKEQNAYVVEDLGEENINFEELLLYFDETGEPRFIINGYA